MNDINIIGKAARMHFSVLNNNKNAVKRTRESNRKCVEALRPLLQQVWDSFDAGHSVNGQITKKQWCARYAKTSQRNCQYILSGGNKNRPDAKRFASLKEGMLVSINGKKFKIAEGEGAISFEKSRDAIRIAVTEIEEEQPAPITSDLPGGLTAHRVKRGRNGGVQVEVAKEKPVEYVTEEAL